MWEKGGSAGILEHANLRATEILSSHFPAYIGAAVDRKIREQFPIRLPVEYMQAGRPPVADS